MSEPLQMSPGSRRSDRGRIRDFQRKLYRKAKQEPEFRFYVLYDKVRSMRFLWEAYRRVKAKGGAPGMDGVTFEEIEEGGLEEFLEGLHAELEMETYVPSPVLRVYIPKANGKQRPLGIPTIRDRVVQMACKLVIEPIFEADFEDSSYGFRPKRSAQEAVAAVKGHLKAGRTEVFDADLSAYFDTIPHAKLMKVLALRISDSKVLHLIKLWLKSPMWEDGRLTGGKQNKLGTPQGGVISPLLANIYLHLIDRLVNKAGSIFSTYGVKIVRYADDFVLLGNSLPSQVLLKLKEVLARMGLRLNVEKSQHLNAREVSFEFLGFTYRYDRSRYGSGRRYWNVVPSKRSEKKLREKLRAYFKRGQCMPVEVFVAGLNRLVRGWVNYYHIPHVSFSKQAFWSLRWYMSRSLYRHFRRKSQRKGTLFRQKGFRGFVEQYGLIDPVRLSFC